jgi:hypothetical protein
MKDRAEDAPLPPWIEHGPLPPFVPQEEWTEENRTNQFETSEFFLRARQSFEGHAYASWYSSYCYDFEHERSGEIGYYLASGARSDDALSAAASRGFVERHRETLADGVVYAELLMSFIYLPPQRRMLRASLCQMRVWLGDTPLIRSALDRRTNIYDDAITVQDEDRVLIALTYQNVYGHAGVGLAADIIARDRDRDRGIRHAILDERGRPLGLEAKLAEARALAEQIPFL